MPRGWAGDARRQCAKLVVVDGYEQLSRLSRQWLKLRCRVAGYGLLVTTHEDVGLPTLARVAPNASLAQSLVERLLGDDHDAIDRETVAECFAASGGKQRERKQEYPGG